ncbi:MAG: riboflavin kinase [Bacteroidota bacterium]|nr:riboflavin kinase [Bacteroidota bacterium]
MRIFYNLDELEVIKNPVVTTGSFDGVHIGHKVIIDRLNQIAKNINGESVLITFHPHARHVLYPETELLLINTQREKIELLKKANLNNLIIINFTREFSKTSSKDFVTKILLDKLHAKVIVVGFNHHFGHNREGNYSYLYDMRKDYNFDVEEIPEQDIENEFVSSTKIRKSLLDGNIQRANAYLDHQYIIIGKLTNGNPDYRILGLPTMKIEIEECHKLIPPDGIYAVHTIIDGKYIKGMMIKDDSKGKNASNEIHFFNYEKITEGDMVTIFLHKRIIDRSIFYDPIKLPKQLMSVSKEIEEMIY